MERFPGRSLVLSGLVISLGYILLLGGSLQGTFILALRLPMYVVIAIVLLGWLVVKIARREGLSATPLDYPIYLLVVVAAASLTVSVDSRISLERFIELFALVLLFYFFVDLLRFPWFGRLLLKSLFLVAGSAVLIAFLELALWYVKFAQVSGLQSGLLPPDLPRLYLVTGNPNSLAAFLVLVIPLVLSRILREVSASKRLKLISFLVLSSVVFFVTFSRGGILGMVVGLTVLSVGYLLLKRKERKLGPCPQSLPPEERSSRKRPWKIGASLAGLATIGLAALFLFYGDFLAKELLHRTGSVGPRFEMWQAALRMISAKPWLGSGLGSFGYLFHTVQNVGGSVPASADAAESVELYFNTPHNLYLNQLVDTGVIGLIPLLWLGIALGWATMRILTRPGGQIISLPALGCFAGLAGFAAHNVVDDFSRVPALPIIATLVAAMLVSQGRDEETRFRSSLSMYLLVPVVFFVILNWVRFDFAQGFQEEGLGRFAIGDYRGAVEKLERAVQIDPRLTYYDYQLGLARSYLSWTDENREDLEKATAALEQELGRGGDFAINRANFASLLWQAGRTQDAVRQMQMAARMDPDEILYHANLGFFFERLGDDNSAISEYGLIVAQSPGYLESAFWRQTNWRQVNLPGIITYARETIAGDTEPASSTRLGELALYEGDTAEALRQFQISADSGSSPAIVHCQLGRVYFLQGRSELAVEELELARQKDPASGSVRLWLGRAYLDKGNTEAASREFRMALFLQSPVAHGYLGQIAEKKGDLAGAIREYEQLPRFNLAPSRYYYYGLFIYHRSELSKQFVPGLMNLVSADELAKLYLELAALYEKEGNQSRAEAVYEKVFAYDPRMMAGDHSSAGTN